MSLSRYCLAFLTATALTGAAHAASLPPGWTSQGNAGSAEPNGDVVGPPAQGPNYFYVTTVNGEYGVGALPGVGGSGSPTNGSTATSTSFTAAAGDVLRFYFNYVTSDGAGFADYAWSRLLTAAGDETALLFTARTTIGSSSVPGFSMPAPTATLEPASVGILAGSVWDALGSSSGRCFSTGCGHTGWVKAEYTVANAGDYKLQFGVVNWTDAAYDSGLAFAGASIGNVDITPPVAAVPLPAGGLLLISGLGALGLARRRNRA